MSNVIENTASVQAVGEVSTDVVYIGGNTSAILSDWMDEMETTVGGHGTSITTLNNSVGTLETVVDGLETNVGTLTDTVDALETNQGSLADRVTALENADTGSAEVEPMCVAAMHLGKLDNNSGAEVSSTTRICSDPIAIENGKSYWQVNDNAANFYVLLYDADEVFLSLYGSVASGAEIAINTEGATYMRLGSLLGDSDLTNEIRIYDVDPASSGSTETAVDAYTKAEADAKFALVDHTHTGFATADHTHTNDHAHANQTVLDGITAEKVAAWDAGTGTGSGSGTTVDAYSKTESDARYATAEHTHDGYATTEALNSVDSDVAQLSSDVANFHSELNLVYDAIDGKAASDHTHTEYATTTDLNNKADASHTHTYSEVGAAASNHTHTPASIGAASASHSHTEYASSSHTHSEYADADHTHSQYSLSGHSHTTNGSCTFTGAIRTYDIYPDATDTRNIGGYSNRYKFIYSINQLQVSSDERAKKDIVSLPVGDLADFVKALRVVEYKYKDDASNKARIGLIAQEINAVNPELASYFVKEEEDGMFGLSVADLVFPLIAAVQELQKQVDELRK